MLQYSYRPRFPELKGRRRDTDQTWIDYLPITERPPIVAGSYRGDDMSEYPVL